MGACRINLLGFLRAGAWLGLPEGGHPGLPGQTPWGGAAGGLVIKIVRQGDFGRERQKVQVITTKVLPKWVKDA
ncbi:hypothetical protein GCM10009525_71820 [Streptosporangium amethystogenes subsp. fukuiense]